MGTGRVCECCSELTSLLQSYDDKREALNGFEDINISREEVETIVLYLQSWSQRQCSCCFREQKNFERFNWALQILVLIVVEVLQRLGGGGGRDDTLAASPDGRSSRRAVWDVDDKDKLIHFVGRIFSNTFPTYVAYKQNLIKADLSPQEVQGLSTFCETNEPEASLYLLRNVALFCKVGGMAALTQCINNHGPDTLYLHQVNILVNLGINVKTWLNFHTALNLYVPFRAAVLGYMCKLVETELKTANARNMAEYIWGAIKDPVDAHLCFDKDGLDLAFHYFMCPTLTMRLAGVNQINNYINLFNELLNSEHIQNADRMYSSLCSWLLENHIVEHIFGPNLHVEVIKQSHTILSFLAMENQLTNEHVEIMWAAAQLKHCSKQVFDILSSLISHMEPGPVLHLHELLKKLEPKDHSEQSLYLASALIKFIWTNATSAIEPGIAHIASSLVTTPASSSSTSAPIPTPTSKRGRQLVVDVVSSSDNSISVAASHSDEEEGEHIRPIKIKGQIQDWRKLQYGSTSSDDDEEESICSDEIKSLSPRYTVEAHSDSDDADEERSGNEENLPQAKPNAKAVKKKKIFKRKKRGPGRVTKLKMGERIIEIQNASHNNSPGESSSMGDIPLDSSIVISPLGSLVPDVELGSSGLQEYGPVDLSDGSYSSRMSTKSEKNMADFDGEDSNCDDDLMPTLSTHTQVEGRRSVVGNIISANTSTLLLPRAMRMLIRRKKFGSQSCVFNFQIDNVCAPGETLLWDLIQDDKIIHLSDGLAIDAQKSLTSLLCYGADKLIRLKFIEGCINNLKNNQAVVVSLRLLPKLLTCFNQIAGPGDIHEVTMWAELEHDMLAKFFQNLQDFTKSNSPTLFPHHIHVQVRLHFLSAVFSTLGSPEVFRLSISQVDQLWSCLATDPCSSDDFFLWLTGQVRTREYHALSSDSFRHILTVLIPSLPPQTITMHSLSLFQQLCNLSRCSGQDCGGLDYLWKIALYANNTDVSMNAIQYLNNYYIGSKLQNEEEFIRRCMNHLDEAAKDLGEVGDEGPMLRIQRALLLLKSHLEIFRRRYAYHLRRWALEGSGVGSHAQLVGPSKGGALPIRILVQPAGHHQKATIELNSSDYVADLRAEVGKWWEGAQKEKMTATACDTTSGGNGGNESVLGNLLSEGPIRLITQGIELSVDLDEKYLSEVPIKDLQLVYLSTSASRPNQKRKESVGSGSEYNSGLPPPPRDKLPMMLLLQKEYFEQLFSLMSSLAETKAAISTKAQMLSRRVWDILMLLPTNPEVHEGFKNLSESSSYTTLLDPSSPQKLMYSLYIVESLVKANSANEEENWKHSFVKHGGLSHLFGIFSSGLLEGDTEWNEWKQDCLASLLKILCYLGVVEEETEYLNELLYDVNEAPFRKRIKRRKGSIMEKTPIPRLSQTMLSVMEVNLVMKRLTNILQACSHQRDPNCYKTGFWGRAQVVHYAMALLVCWAFSHQSVRSALYSQPGFSAWLCKLLLEDPEPAVRREVCTGLYRLCLGVSTDGENGLSHAPQLISHLLFSLNSSLNIRSWNQQNTCEDGKESYGPACRDYFWLLSRLLDSLEDSFVRDSMDSPQTSIIDINELAIKLREAIHSREFLEQAHSLTCDDALVGLLTTMTVVMKHNPRFKSSQDGQCFITQLFSYLFALPSPTVRFMPKCKSQQARSAAYDLLVEMVRFCPDNYTLLHSLLIEQHQVHSHNAYPWDYWPHEDGRAACGFVGLTNLGATCYMASTMQHLYMMPQARACILGAKVGSGRHSQTLRELQKMFAYLMESERKAYNPREFCKVYQMDHKPLNTGEQKDMAEFFIDLVSKIEEMSPELKQLVKTLFCGVTSNNVVSLDCSHVSRTMEEFYTVRCQVADMRSLTESLDEVTVKDTLDGDNMYTCSTCGKKVRAEKRACFKKLPNILCFNTMRYTFNMITMMKEKVNTHFSFPFQLDMTGYVEKTLMPQQYQEEKERNKKSAENEDECHLYDLIGITVHTGTADGGHYYSFIRDRFPPNKDKWYLFNDAEVKQFDPNQLPNECFGGEMNTKTYDSVTDKFMDFSFEKTNSAYMLFYERSPSTRASNMGSSETTPNLPGGSASASQPQQMELGPPNAETAPSYELSKELEDWIWLDNTHFLKDKNIFEHTYFNFMSQICYQIPQTLCGQNDIMNFSAKLSATFFLETFIHAKEKPTMVQWMDILNKQLLMSSVAANWFLTQMASEGNNWIGKILLKCPNQIVRQMFQRLCYHITENLRHQQASLYSKMPEGLEFTHPDEIEIDEFGQFSPVAKFIEKYLSLLDQCSRTNLKNLTEYFTFLMDFSKLGDEECLLLINLEAISKMVNFYLSIGRRDENSDHGSGEEEEEDIISVPSEKSKVASLEKMIALIASLVEKSRDESNELKLSRCDKDALLAPRKGSHFYSFPFLLQQIRDGLNYTSTRNLIFSLCRWNDKRAEEIVIGIFQAIQKHPDTCHPYFKMLNLLAELVSGPPALPKFTELILTRILDVSEMCPYPTLEWLSIQVPRNKVVHSWCLHSMATWVEHFLITNNNQRVRNAAASLLVSLVPNQAFRQGYKTTRIYGSQHGSNREVLQITGEALVILHEIYQRLLTLLKPAKHYTDINSHGISKLISYFAVMTYFCVSKTEKLMFTPYFMDLWNLFHPRISEPSNPTHHNKSSLLNFWYHVCSDCPENVQRIISNPSVWKHIGFNYILADHEDQDVVQFNRTMLPAYYAILRMCCQQSRQFALHLARHQNITWAFKNISPFQSQFPGAAEELFKIMQIIVQRGADASEQEIQEINHFKRHTLQLYMQSMDGRASWGTLISAFRILVENHDDRIFIVGNSGLNLLFMAIHMLHKMHHESAACHVSGEMVEILSLLTDILRSFRPKEFSHGMNQHTQGHGSNCVTIEEVSVQRYIALCKEWPDILRKLITLLNTYNCSDLRNSATETLIEFLYIMPLDTLRALTPLMVHCHTVCQDAQTSGMGPTLGPYFPKRSSSNNMVSRSNVRPPRPLLQMAFPHLGQETAKGQDEDYDRALQEFYGQYHFFVDLMCRVAFMKDCVTPELITLSAMLGYEAAPLHFIHFPKLWLEVYNTPSINREHIQMLVNSSYFTDYVELVILEERTCLTNIVIFNFLATYLPKVFDQIATTDQMCKALVSIKLDMQNMVQKQITNVETLAMGVLGDLKVISLFYLPTINGKGQISNPLPSPAPTTVQMLIALKQLNFYMETLLTNLNKSQTQPGDSNTEGDVPSKKRKLDQESEDAHPSICKNDAAEQKVSITRDLIMLLLGTIDTLVRGLSSPTDDATDEVPSSSSTATKDKLDSTPKS